jgi:hypothetical protein
VQFVGLGKYVGILLKTFITHAATATTCAYQNTRAASPTFHSAFNPPVSIQTASHVPKTTTSLSYRYNTNLISPASHRTPYIVSLSYHIAAVSIIHPSRSCHLRIVQQQHLLLHLPVRNALEACAMRWWCFSLGRRMRSTG